MNIANNTPQGLTEIDWQAKYERLNESIVKNKRLFSDGFAEKVIEQQKKRIHQLETELIEAKYQLRQNEKPTNPVCRACSGDGYVESGPYTRKCENCNGTGQLRKGEK